MLDVILKNGQIFDGSGKDPVIGNIGIKDGVAKFAEWYLDYYK